MNKLLLLIALASLAVGCATKNYGRQGELTDFERHTLTCREIDIERAKVDGYLTQIDKESEFDGRSVLSFLGDLGIGNTMEKSAARRAAQNRLSQLQSLSLQRGCGSPGPAAPEASAVTPF